MAIQFCGPDLAARRRHVDFACSFIGHRYGGRGKVDSSLGFAIQSIVILIATWAYVIVTGKTRDISSVEPRAWGFLLGAGLVSSIAYLTNGAGWIESNFNTEETELHRGFFGICGPETHDFSPQTLFFFVFSVLKSVANPTRTTGYLFYFAAIKSGDVSRVAPLDRLSLVFAIVFAVMFLGEKVNSPTLFGAALMAVGAAIIAVAGTSSKLNRSYAVERRFVGVPRGACVQRPSQRASRRYYKPPHNQLRNSYKRRVKS